MAKQTGALVFTVGADTRPLAKNLKKAQSMIGGFGAGVGRVGVGLAKVGAGAVVGLGATILAARGAFRGLMKLAPYSDDLATALGNMINVGEDLKRRMADALVPAVDTLSQALNEAAPVIADAAVTLADGVLPILKWLAGLGRPGGGGVGDVMTAAYAGTISRQFMNDPKTADQISREMPGGEKPWNRNLLGVGATVYGPGEAGMDQLGVGATGGGVAGEYKSLLEEVARNTATPGEGF